MNLFNKILYLKGMPAGAAASRLAEAVEHVIRDRDTYHHEQKWEIFRFHKQHNTWYNSRLANITGDAWEDIPVLQKQDIQRPLIEMLSHGYSPDNVYKNNTSGSTGRPFHFAKDKFAHAMTWAYIVKRYRDLGLDYGRSKQARFFGIPLSRKGFWKETFKDFLSARVRFPVFDLSDPVLEEYLRKFEKIRFEYIYGYSSSLVLFANFLVRRQRVLKDCCPSLRYCIVTSEVCSPEDEKVLEQGFGVKVINEYGAAELDIIAFEDEDGDWILNEENLYIEILDEAGNPVPDGSPGNVVVTALYNKAMPFIRYNLGDIAIVDKQRKNGRRKLKEMQGRINDVALLPSGKKSPGLTFYYISKGLLNEGGFLREFTIKQLSLDHFHFDYVAEAELTESQKNKVYKMMDVYLEPGLKASFQRVAKIERSGAGKFKHFQRQLNQQSQEEPGSDKLSH